MRIRTWKREKIEGKQSDPNYVAKTDANHEMPPGERTGDRWTAPPVEVHPYTAKWSKQPLLLIMTNDILRVDYTGKNEFLALEKQVLSQYQTLAIKLNTLADEIAKLNRHLPSGAQLALDPTTGLADSLLRNMHNLERKVGLVYTLFRTAVYTLLLQNQESKEPNVLEDFSAPLD